MIGKCYSFLAEEKLNNFVFACFSSLFIVALCISVAYFPINHSREQVSLLGRPLTKRNDYYGEIEEFF